MAKEVRRLSHQEASNPSAQAREVGFSDRQMASHRDSNERAARYPVQDDQFAPTALGNAIRRFETYAEIATDSTHSYYGSI